MNQPLVPATFLFRFTIPCRYQPTIWSPDGVLLDEGCRVPVLRELDGSRAFGDLRAAWNESGLTFVLRVSGKKQPPWCRASRIEDSDGLQIWLDTRDMHTVHRASRFCHRFALLPMGDGPRLEDPFAGLLAINRARESCRPIEPGVLKIRSERRVDGYWLAAHLPAAALTGFDPAEHAKLGFSYAIIDRELGRQTLSMAPEFRFDEDPSLWESLELLPKVRPARGKARA